MKCAVLCCNFKYGVRLPADEHERREWLKIIGRLEYKSRFGLVCGLHFNKADLIRTSKKLTVKPGARPTHVFWQCKYCSQHCKEVNYHALRQQAIKEEKGSEILPEVMDMVTCKLEPVEEMDKTATEADYVQNNLNGEQPHEVEDSKGMLRLMFSENMDRGEDESLEETNGSEEENSSYGTTYRGLTVEESMDSSDDEFATPEEKASRYYAKLETLRHALLKKRDALRSKNERIRKKDQQITKLKNLLEEYKKKKFISEKYYKQGCPTVDNTRAGRRQVKVVMHRW